MKPPVVARILLAAAAITFFSFARQAGEPQTIYAETITAADLETHLDILASDAYEGRETGEKGQKMSAEYIAAQFKSFGIPELPGGGYYQDVPLMSKRAGAGVVTANGKTYKFREHFYYTSGITDGVVSAEGFVFAGYGIQDSLYKDYKGVNAKDKIVMALAEEPTDKDGNSKITGTKQKSPWTTQRRLKINEARKQGAAALFIVWPDFEKALKDNAHAIESPTLQLYEETSVEVFAGQKTRPMPVVYISKAMADELLAAGKQKKNVDKIIAAVAKKKKAPPIAFKLPVTIDITRPGTVIHSENVLGYLEGSDLKEELIVITAHYDHLGKEGDVVFNGADDDGSGTVAVIELAQAFAQAKKNGHGPRRSILFMTVTGEEKGLLGSSWYTKYPVFPLKNTVCNLNIDMIGRIDEAHIGDSSFVYVIGSEMLSSELKQINEEANANFTKLKLDYRYDAPNDPNMFYYRSDHYNFAKRGIPVAFFFNGVHADYHKETDEVSKIIYPLMAVRTKLVFHTAWELVNRDKRIVVDKKTK